MFYTIRNERISKFICPSWQQFECLGILRSPIQSINKQIKKSSNLANVVYRTGVKITGGQDKDDFVCMCHSADETVEHLVCQCPAHDQARKDIWPGDTFTTDSQCLWSYLERIWAVTRPPPDREWEREREDDGCLLSTMASLDPYNSVTQALYCRRTITLAINTTLYTAEKFYKHLRCYLYYYTHVPRTPTCSCCSTLYN